MWGWRATALLVLLTVTVVSASEQLLSREVEGPGWFEIQFSGSGSIEINISSTDALAGAAVVIIVYDENGTVRESCLCQFADSDAWVRASVPGIIDESVRIGQEDYGILSRTRVIGSVSNWSAIAWAANPGHTAFTVSAITGSWQVELVHSGEGGFYSNGGDLGGPQVVASYFGVRTQAQYEVRWPFHTEGTLLGFFDRPFLPPAGVTSSHVVGPSGNVDCPCFFTNREGPAALPPGDYEYVQTSASVDAFAGAVIVAMDYDRQG